MRSILAKLHAGGDGTQLVKPGDPCNNPENHTASSATPPATRAAPSHRLASTRSLRRTRAKIVSNTKLAAEAGTAKLRSASDTRVMNAKNDTAMHAIARIKYFLRASAKAMRRRPLPKTNLAVALHFKALESIPSNSAGHNQRDQQPVLHTVSSSDVRDPVKLTSEVPATISSVPDQRNQLICSFRTNLPMRAVAM